MEKPTNKELIYLGLVLILLVGFYLQLIAFKADLKSYKEAYLECVGNIDKYNSGYYDPFDRQILNITIQADNQLINIKK